MHFKLAHPSYSTVILIQNYTVQYYAFGTNKYQIPLKVYMTPEWGGLIIAVDQVYF